MLELRPTVATTYTARNASQPSGSAMPKQQTSPVRKNPRKKRIFFPWKSASDPRMGIRIATARLAMVCAYPNDVTTSLRPAASSSESR